MNSNGYKLINKRESRENHQKLTFKAFRRPQNPKK